MKQKYSTTRAKIDLVNVTPLNNRRYSNNSRSLYSPLPFNNYSASIIFSLFTIKCYLAECFHPKDNEICQKQNLACKVTNATQWKTKFLFHQLQCVIFFAHFAKRQFGGKQRQIKIGWSHCPYYAQFYFESIGQLQLAIRE